MPCHALCSVRSAALARCQAITDQINKKPAGLHWRVFLFLAGREGQADKKD